LAIFAAVHRNSLIDRVILTTSIASSSIPTVWLGLLLIILFSVKFREWNLPYSLPINGVKDTRNPGGFWDLVEHMILPVIALALPQIAGWIWYIRNAMIDALQQDYVRTLRSRGIPTRSVLLKHALRNAAPASLTVLSLQFIALISGAVVIEKVFGLTGIGERATSAANQGDIPLVLGIVMVTVVLVVIVNLLVDLALGWLNPKVRIS
jgi:peptide/nickel transport system permease protein